MLLQNGLEEEQFFPDFFRGEGGEQSVLPGDFDPNLEGRFGFDKNTCTVHGSGFLFLSRIRENNLDPETKIIN